MPKFSELIKLPNTILICCKMAHVNYINIIINFPKLLTTIYENRFLTCI